MREQCESSCRDIGNYADDDVDKSLEPGRQRREQVPQIGLDAVRHCTGDRAPVQVGGHNSRLGAPEDKDLGDGSGPGADLDRDTGRGQALQRAPSQGLALPSRHVDARFDADLQAAERHRSRDPGQRLPRQTTPDERGEALVVAVRASKELAGLLVGGDESGPREHSDQSLVAVRNLHAAIRPREEPGSRSPSARGHDGELDM